MLPQIVGKQFRLKEFDNSTRFFRIYNVEIYPDRCQFSIQFEGAR